MKSRTHRLLPLLVAAVSIFSVAAQATPKAAEHEDAPVTMGADVARPKLSAKPARQKVTAKARATIKGKPVNHKASSRKK